MSLLLIQGQSAEYNPGIALSEVPVKTVFCRHDNKDYFIRVKPVSYLLNSTLVQDKLASGFCIIVSMTSGTMYFAKGSELVVPVTSAVLNIRK